MNKRGSHKRFKNFSKLLFNINFAQTHYLRNSKTLDKKQNKNTSQQNSYSHLIIPEIDYVSKLSFYSPESSKDDNNILNNFKTVPNFNPSSLYPQNKNINIRTFIEEKNYNQKKTNLLIN